MPSRDVLSPALAEMNAAFDVVEGIHGEVAALSAVRIERTWTAQEHSRYVSLMGRERRALRRYLAARVRFDAARQRARLSR